MKYWIYKCNAKDQDFARYSGDWRSGFFSRKDPGRWGSTEVVEELARLSPGDRIIAHQTDKNELVGLAEVVELRDRGGYKDLILRPLEIIGVKVRPLKKSDSRIAAIPALQPGPIATLYVITNEDAEHYLKVAGNKVVKGGSSSKPVVKITSGAGFGSSPEQNKKVEMAAIAAARKYYEDNGWTVDDLSAENRGYDLVCTKKKAVEHVEVKGISGSDQAFVLTKRTNLQSGDMTPTFSCSLSRMRSASMSCTNSIRRRYRYSSSHLSVTA